MLSSLLVYPIQQVTVSWKIIIQLPLLQQSTSRCEPTRTPAALGHTLELRYPTGNELASLGSATHLLCGASPTHSRSLVVRAQRSLPRSLAMTMQRRVDASGSCSPLSWFALLHLDACLLLSSHHLTCLERRGVNTL